MSATNNNQTLVGVDLGGTEIKAGLLATDGGVLERSSRPTNAPDGADAVVLRVIDVVRHLRDRATGRRCGVIGIGLGVAGSVRPDDGVVSFSPNLPGWRDVPLARRVAEATGVSVHLENDANTAATGELWSGAGRGCKDVAVITLGTGIGGGLVLGGRLWRGRFGNAGELGHMIVEVGGLACKCGQRGCLEAYASATATAQRAAARLAAGEASSLTAVMSLKGEVTSLDVVEAARSGDALSRRVWDETCRYLAIACVNLQHLLNFERIVLAGGMSAAGPDLLEPVRRHFGGLMWADIGDRPQIVLGELGNDAGFIGAARMAVPL